MGVFLRVGGEFLVLAAGFNYGYLKWVMTILLVGVAVYTIMGGMLSVLITDFLQFVVMSVGLLAVTYLILYQLGWDKIVETVETNYGAKGFNPILHPDLGWSYLIFQFFLQTAATLTWQTTIARVLAAKDVKTGKQIYTRTSFFFVARFMIPAIWGIAALAMLTAQDLAVLPPEMQKDPSLYAMPLFLGKFVPIGLSGLLIAAMLAADMSTDSSYMLTWASVIYNDIMAPFRKGTWSERRGLFWNRTIVALIGVFLLIYGLWYPMKGDLWTYLGVTGTVYLASMSTLLIACCYWKRSNDWGAAAAIVVGAVFPIGFLVAEQLPATQDWAKNTVGPWVSGIAAYVGAAIAMVVGSYLKPNSKVAA
jgi:SSS family solute:Na+ symporter